MKKCLGVAQLVARDFWEVEAAGSSPVTQTIFLYHGAWRSSVARTHGVREVRSSNLLVPTRNSISGCGAVGSALA